MAYEEITAVLGGWPGFVVRQVTREPGGTRSGAPQVTIALEPIPGTQRYCSRCGQLTTQVHDVAERRIPELPILDAETWFVLALARLGGPDFGATVEALAWL